MKFKEFFYWFSIIGPVYDIVRGAIAGIAECVGKYSYNRRYISELNKFNLDNEKPVDDLSRVYGDVYLERFLKENNERK